MHSATSNIRQVLGDNPSAELVHEDLDKENIWIRTKAPGHTDVPVIHSDTCQHLVYAMYPGTQDGEKTWGISSLNGQQIISTGVKAADVALLIVYIKQSFVLCRRVKDKPHKRFTQCRMYCCFHDIYKNYV